jgi:hypothetical protein
MINSLSSTKVHAIEQPIPTVIQKHSRRRSVIHEFCLNTSTHGLPGFARGHSIHNRLFWIISTSIFTGVMIYFVAASITEYFRYPKQTSVTLATEWPVTFPAFTFCNACPLRYDTFIEPFLNYTNARNLTNTNDTSSFTEYQAKYIPDFLNMRINRNESNDIFFYPLSEMLMFCRYNNMPCSTSDFISFTSASYGRCYTFNAKRKNVSNGGVRNNNENGQNGKLSLQLYVHSHQYIPYFTDGTSI